jgi:regulator of sirC expression with transglutaminase-like and TPR domain
MLRPVTVIFGAILAFAGAVASAAQTVAELAFPTTAEVSKSPGLQTLQALFESSDSSLDLAQAKLVIDRMIDPSIDPDAVQRQLDVLVESTRSRFPVEASSRVKLDTLLSTIYQPGAWNDFRPFSYDLDDPFGKNIENKVLSTYLATRKGNCVSMPILLVILGQRLELPMTLATAPGHVLVKFADDTQQAWVNIEATAGGFKFDSSYERELGISATAIENGIYLRPLSPGESLGVMTGTLMEHSARQQDGDALLAMADLALQANPMDAVAMIWKASAYYLQLQQRYVQHYPTAADIPVEQRADYQRLSRENLAWFAKAEQLGWTQPTPEQEAKYLQSIQHEKKQRRQ